MRDAEHLPVDVDHDLVFLITVEDSYKSLAVFALGHRSERPDPNLAPGELAEMLRGPQGTIQAGAADLQVVRALDRVLHVEGSRDGPRDRAAVVERHAAGLVDEEPQRLPASPTTDLHVDQLQSFLGSERT